MTVLKNIYVLLVQESRKCLQLKHSGEGIVGDVSEEDGSSEENKNDENTREG